MNYSCRWARRKKDSVEAASDITARMFKNLGLDYQSSPGFSSFGDSDFNLSGFMEDIGNTSDETGANCIDMAKSLVIFTNITGSDLSYSECEPFGSLIQPPPLKIKVPGNSINPKEFSYHSFAKYTQNSDYIFDSCIAIGNYPH